MEIENHKDCAEIQNYMSQLTVGRTVPRVFISGECVGGGSEASAVQQSGELKKEFKVP
jgi:glutaredoxin 3